MEPIPIDLAIVEEAYSLPEPFHNDPADRIIVATARILSCQLLPQTKNNFLSTVETIW